MVTIQVEPGELGRSYREEEESKKHKENDTGKPNRELM